MLTKSIYNLPFNQETPIFLCDKRLAYSAILIKQIPEQAKPEIPLQCLSQRLTLFEPQFFKYRRQRKCQIQQFLVEEGDQVILLSHDAICNVMGV